MFGPLEASIAEAAKINDLRKNFFVPKKDPKDEEKTRVPKDEEKTRVPCTCSTCENWGGCGRYDKNGAHLG
jgi:hypothetical protein